MYGYIYKITNLITDKIYIGQHIGEEFDKKYFGSGKLLKDAIKKYGKKNFKKEILEFCQTEEDLNEREKYWIFQLNSTDKNVGYNISFGGQDGCFRNLSHTKEERQKISASSKDRVWINNGITNKFIKRTELESYLQKDWSLGRIIKNSFENLSTSKMQIIGDKISAKKKGKFYFYNDLTSDCKMISRDQIDHYEQLGYHYGTAKLDSYSHPIIYINNGEISLRCHYSEVGNYLKSSEWVIGKIKTVKVKTERIKPGHHPHTEETKQKIREARARQTNLVLCSNTGKKWYNNGQTSKLFFEEDVPEGFEAGRLLTSASREKLRKSAITSNSNRKGKLDKIAVIKNGKIKVIGKNNLDKYLNQGYIVYKKGTLANEK